MIFIFVIFAFILTWFFIEITLFIVNRYYNSSDKLKEVFHKKFVWKLRMLAISLIFVTVGYMYFFENDKFLQAVKYCLGVVL
tara:strand:- start:130 stop:375 length:246 start_codon:yes stop_codon:yes gene_type:complete